MPAGAGTVDVGAADEREANAWAAAAVAPMSCPDEAPMKALYASMSDWLLVVVVWVMLLLFDDMVDVDSLCVCCGTKILEK